MVYVALLERRSRWYFLSFIPSLAVIQYLVFMEEVRKQLWKLGNLFQIARSTADSIAQSSLEFLHMQHKVYTSLIVQFQNS